MGSICSSSQNVIKTSEISAPANQLALADSLSEAGFHVQQRMHLYFDLFFCHLIRMSYDGFVINAKDMKKKC